MPPIDDLDFNSVVLLRSWAEVSNDFDTIEVYCIALYGVVFKSPGTKTSQAGNKTTELE